MASIESSRVGYLKKSIKPPATSFSFVQPSGFTSARGGAELSLPINYSELNSSYERLQSTSRQTASRSIPPLRHSKQDESFERGVEILFPPSSRPAVHHPSNLPSIQKQLFDKVNNINSLILFSDRTLLDLPPSSNWVKTDNQPLDSTRSAISSIAAPSQIARGIYFEMLDGDFCGQHEPTSGVRVPPLPPPLKRPLRQTNGSHSATSTSKRRPASSCKMVGSMLQSSSLHIPSIDTQPVDSLSAASAILLETNSPCTLLTATATPNQQTRTHQTNRKRSITPNSRYFQPQLHYYRPSDNCDPPPSHYIIIPSELQPEPSVFVSSKPTITNQKDNQQSTSATRQKQIRSAINKQNYIQQQEKKSPPFLAIAAPRSLNSGHVELDKQQSNRHTTSSSMVSTSLGTDKYYFLINQQQGGGSVNAPKKQRQHEGNNKQQQNTSREAISRQTVDKRWRSTGRPVQTSKDSGGNIKVSRKSIELLQQHEGSMTCRAAAGKDQDYTDCLEIDLKIPSLQPKTKRTQGFFVNTMNANNGGVHAAADSCEQSSNCDNQLGSEVYHVNHRPKLQQQVKQRSVSVQQNRSDATSTIVVVYQDDNERAAIQQQQNNFEDGELFIQRQTKLNSIRLKIPQKKIINQTTPPPPLPLLRKYQLKEDHKQTTPKAIITSAVCDEISLNSLRLQNDTTTTYHKDISIPIYNSIKQLYVKGKESELPPSAISTASTTLKKIVKRRPASTIQPNEESNNKHSSTSLPKHQDPHAEPQLPTVQKLFSQMTKTTTIDQSSSSSFPSKPHLHKQLFVAHQLPNLSQELPAEEQQQPHHTEEGGGGGGGGAPAASPFRITDMKHFNHPRTATTLPLKIKKIKQTETLTEAERGSNPFSDKEEEKNIILQTSITLNANLCHKPLLTAALNNETIQQPLHFKEQQRSPSILFSETPPIEDSQDSLESSMMCSLTLSPPRQQQQQQLSETSSLFLEETTQQQKQQQIVRVSASMTCFASTSAQKSLHDVLQNDSNGLALSHSFKHTTVSRNHQQSREESQWEDEQAHHLPTLEQESKRFPLLHNSTESPQQILPLPELVSTRKEVDETVKEEDNIQHASPSSRFSSLALQEIPSIEHTYRQYSTPSLDQQRTYSTTPYRHTNLVQVQRYPIRETEGEESVNQTLTHENGLEDEMLQNHMKIANDLQSSLSAEEMLELHIERNRRGIVKVNMHPHLVKQDINKLIANAIIITNKTSRSSILSFEVVQEISRELRSSEMSFGREPHSTEQKVRSFRINQNSQVEQRAKQSTLLPIMHGTQKELSEQQCSALLIYGLGQRCSSSLVDEWYRMQALGIIDTTSPSVLECPVVQLLQKPLVYEFRPFEYKFYLQVEDFQPMEGILLSRFRGCNFYKDDELIFICSSLLDCLNSCYEKGLHLSAEVHLENVVFCPASSSYKFLRLTKATSINEKHRHLHPNKIYLSPELTQMNTVNQPRDEGYVYDAYAADVYAIGVIMICLKFDMIATNRTAKNVLKKIAEIHKSQGTAAKIISVLLSDDAGVRAIKSLPSMLGDQLREARCFGRAAPDEATYSQRNSSGGLQVLSQLSSRVQAQQNIARVYKETHQYERAVNTYLSNLEMMRGSSKKVAEREILFTVNEIWQLLYMTENFEDALHYNEVFFNNLERVSLQEVFLQSIPFDYLMSGKLKWEANRRVESSQDFDLALMYSDEFPLLKAQVLMLLGDFFTEDSEISAEQYFIDAAKIIEQIMQQEQNSFAQGDNEEQDQMIAEELNELRESSEYLLTNLQEKAGKQLYRIQDLQRAELDEKLLYFRDAESTMSPLERAKAAFEYADLLNNKFADYARAKVFYEAALSSLQQEESLAQFQQPKNTQIVTSPSSSSSVQPIASIARDDFVAEILRNYVVNLLRSNQNEEAQKIISKIVVQNSIEKGIKNIDSILQLAIILEDSGYSELSMQMYKRCHALSETQLGAQNEFTLKLRDKIFRGARLAATK